MKKIIALVLLLCASSFALNPFAWYWNISLTGDTATVVKWKNNNDSVRLWNIKVADTLNKGIPRWASFRNHDSTFRWMNIDTIPSADVIAVTSLTATATATGTLAASGTATFSGLVAATTATFSALVTATTATFSGTVNADSMHSSKGISAVGLIQTTGSIKAVGDIYTVPLTTLPFTLDSNFFGWSFVAGGQAYYTYKKIGKTVTIWFGISGDASNSSTDANFLLPYPSAVVSRSIISVLDQTNDDEFIRTGLVVTAVGSNVATLFHGSPTDGFGSAWRADGGPKSAEGTFTYEAQ